MQVKIATSNQLPEGSSKEATKVPVHVAIIMDGNGR